MVSKYYNVNLRMPNYWSSGVLRKTGNKIFVYLAPDYIIGEYKNGILKLKILLLILK